MKGHLIATVSAVALLATSAAVAAPQPDPDAGLLILAQGASGEQPGVQPEPETGAAPAGEQPDAGTGVVPGAGESEDVERSDTRDPDTSGRRIEQYGGEMLSYNTNREAFEGQLTGTYAAEDLLGASIESESGETVGEVEDILVSNNEVDKLIVDVGGFLGVSEHTVALDVEDVSETNGELTVSMTQEELQAMPAFEQRDDGEWWSEEDADIVE